VNGYEKVGAGIGSMLGVGFILSIWFLVMLFAMVIGFFLKTSTVENGPTGALASASGEAANISSGIMAVVIFALVFLIDGLNKEKFSQSSRKAPVLGKDTQQVEKERTSKNEITTAYDEAKAGNYNEAIKILRPYADQGDASAQFMLGAVYTMDESPNSSDYCKRKEWHLRAAAQGEAHAQKSIGWFYETGTCLPSVNLAEAYKWIKLYYLTDKGFSARVRLTEVESKLTRAQIAEGDSLAHAWKPVIESHDKPQEIVAPPQPSPAEDPRQIAAQPPAQAPPKVIQAVTPEAQQFEPTTHIQEHHLTPEQEASACKYQIMFGKGDEYKEMEYEGKMHCVKR
jgi:uncharacterized membrane protein